jgi:hypothetical protein
MNKVRRRLFYVLLISLLKTIRGFLCIFIFTICRDNIENPGLSCGRITSEMCRHLGLWFVYVLPIDQDVEQTRLH